ncbi:MAG: fibronectin type III domain-containing protein [Bacteroidales bacterium]
MNKKNFTLLFALLIGLHSAWSQTATNSESISNSVPSSSQSIVSRVSAAVAALPAAPTALVATPSDVSVSIAFTPPTGTITNYQYSIDNGATFTAFSPVDNASPVVITGLACGTVYQIKLKAVNSSGAGTASAVVSATTTIAAPTSLVATPTTTSASIAFTAPSGTMTNYQYSTNGGTSYTACSPAVTGSPITISGLTANTAYQVMLKAQNATGVGAASTALTVTTLPVAPTALVATPSINSVSIAFTKPAGTITNYQYSIDNGATFTAFLPVDNATPVVINGLTGGTTYQVQLRAVNASGAGTASATVSFTTLLAAPTNVVATPSFNTISLAFTPPAGTITDYYYSLDNGANYKSAASPVTSSPFLIVALLTNTTYQVLLKAVNSAGVAGTATTMITIKTLPSAPTILTSTPGDGSASIAFTPPTGTAAITNYQYSIDNGATFTALSPADNTSPVVIPGLSSGATYPVQLKAVNSSGAGVASATVYATYFAAGCSELAFNGSSSYVNLATAPPVSNTFSVEAWIRILNNNLLGSIFSWSTSATANTNMQLINYYGSLGISYTPVSGSAKYYYGASVYTERWYHVAYTQNATTSHLYLNGVLAFTGVSCPVPSNYNFAAIGATILQDGTRTSNFSGVIQDVRVWNVERSAADILGYKDAILSGSETGLVAYYKMKGSTTITNSATGGAYPGTNNNCTWNNALAPSFSYFNDLSDGTTGQSVRVNDPITPIVAYFVGRDLAYQWYSNTTASNVGGTSLGSANGAQTNTYTPQSTTPGTTYYYCVAGSCFTATSDVTQAYWVDSKILAPTALVATSGNGSVSVDFKEPPSHIIKNYEYTLDNGAHWINTGFAKSPISITGLQNCTNYSIKLRASNDAGKGYESEAVIGTPINGLAAGTKWTAYSIASHNWCCLTYGNGLYVALAIDGSAMTSPDAITWTNQTVPQANNWTSITYGNGLFVGVASLGGDHRVITSPDGVNWTAPSIASSIINWRSITYGNGLYVAVSSSGYGNGRVLTSRDGITWALRNAAQANSWQSVAYGNGLFVAISNSGNKRVMTSSDGITWTARSSADESVSWQSVTYGNGQFVAVSYDGSLAMTSPNGINWTARDLYGQFNSITYGNGQFVVLGSSINSSADGINWTQRYADLNQWQCVTYGKDRFVAVSSSGDNRAISSTFAAPYSSPILNSITTGDASASVAFTEGASNGGSAVSHYQYSIDNGTNWITPSPAAITSPLLITGLTNGAVYPIALRAVNNEGTSCASNVVSATPATLPSAPSALVATAGISEVSVAFTAGDNGGSDIIDYTVTSNPDNLTQIGATSPLVVTGLTPGTYYTFTVTARNSIGNSLASEVSNSVTPSQDIVTGSTNISSGNLSITTNGNRQIVINGLLKGESTITVYNQLGQSLICKNLTSTTKVLDNKLPIGLYIITVTNAGKSVKTKLIIK